MKKMKNSTAKSLLKEMLKQIKKSDKTGKVGKKPLKSEELIKTDYLISQEIRQVNEKLARLKAKQKMVAEKLLPLVSEKPTYTTLEVDGKTIELEGVIEVKSATSNTVNIQKVREEFTDVEFMSMASVTQKAITDAFGSVRLQKVIEKKTRKVSKLYIGIKG